MNLKKTIKVLVLFFCFALLILGGFITILYLFADNTLLGLIITMFRPEISIFFIFVYLAASILIIYLLFRRSLWKSIITLTWVFFIIIIALLPSLTIPWIISNAENEMLSSYPTTYTTLTPKPGFRQTPFSWWEYFNGVPIPMDQIDIKTDIEYNNNGQDSFTCDIYKPLKSIGPLPVIIALHGGAWILGDKGVGNIAPLSKILAAQGYLVFDLRFGLMKTVDLLSPFNKSDLGNQLDGLLSAVNPPYNGSYSIPDQVRNIGQFTKWLVAHKNEFDADLNKIFTLGRSGGAHMAGVVGLGYNNPLFSGDFDPAITIKGIILFYPPTNMLEMRNDVESGFIGGFPFIAPMIDVLLEDKDNPGAIQLSLNNPNNPYNKYSHSHLITYDNLSLPPIIIFHGSKDNLVPYQKQAVNFQTLAKSYGRKCLLITIVGDGHALDIPFSGRGGQISTYYVERFLALETA